MAIINKLAKIYDRIEKNDDNVEYNAGILSNPLLSILDILF